MHFIEQEIGSHVGGKQKSREHSATLLGLSTRTVGDWVRDFEVTTYIVDSRRGKHSKTLTPINNPGFRQEFKDHVKQNSRKSGLFQYNTKSQYGFSSWEP